MQSAKDMAASAKAGMEKTKATLQEKGERMTTRDPLQKEMATAKKDERMSEAEREKWDAQQRNARAADEPGYTVEDDMDVIGGGGGPTTGRAARNLV